MHSVSVVTPSFNQAAYLPDCLRSVREQSLRPVEHLIYDPGSTDGSREIAAAAQGVTLMAEPDDGQADAVGRGMARATGDVICWLNSDDRLADAGVLAAVVERFSKADRPDVVYGRGRYVDAGGQPLREAYVNAKPETLAERLQHEVGLLQPAVFLRRSALTGEAGAGEVGAGVGGPDASLNFALDYDLWIRLVKAGRRFAYLDRLLAEARYYPDNKTAGQREASLLEATQTAVRHFGYAPVQWLRRLAEHRIEGMDNVLRDSGNTRVADEPAVQRETDRLLAAWDWPHEAKRVLRDGRNRRPTAATVRAMQGAGVSLDRVCEIVPENIKTGGGRVCYTVGERRWAFGRGWYDDQMQHTAAMLETLRAERRGDTAVLVGNGPSLNRTDLSLLAGVDTFVSNYAYMKPELFQHATHLAVVNHLVAEQGAGRFNELTKVWKMFPYWLGYCLSPGERTLLFPSVGHAVFSTDPLENVSWRHTVSFFQLQIIYGLGYRRCVMIGFDHSYRQTPQVKEGDTIAQYTADPNHFDPNYFRGKSWHAADVDAMERMYVLAKEAYEADGGEILNATEGGHLELFPRVALSEAVLAADERR